MRHQPHHSFLRFEQGSAGKMRDRRAFLYLSWVGSPHMGTDHTYVEHIHMYAPNPNYERKKRSPNPLGKEYRYFTGKYKLFDEYIHLVHTCIIYTLILV